MVTKYKAVEVNPDDVAASHYEEDGVVTSVDTATGEERPYAVVYNRALNRYLAIVPVEELLDFKAVFKA